jgi:drug/metabolite transporter (DMT)-like permease
MSACFVFSLGVRVALVSKNNNDHTSRDTIGDHQTIRDIRHLLKIALLSVVFVLSVVSGNISLRYIPVSFNQAISATTPLFTAILSYVILHKRETIETYIMLIPVTAGVVIASENEPMFNSYGFVACITATFMRALKSVLQGLILADEKDKLDPFSLLLFMSPIAFTILVLACSMMESNAFEVMSAKMMMSSSTKIVSFEVTLFLNCILAFLVNLSNFMVTKSTSPLTLQVLGNAKSVLAVVISVMLFHNPVSAIGMIGYCVSLLGIYLYSDAKSRSSGSNNFSLARVVGTIFFKLTDDKDKDDDEDCERNLRRGYENVKIMNESVNRNTHHIL